MGTFGLRTNSSVGDRSEILRLTKGLEFLTNISRMSSTAFAALIGRGRENGVVLASDCRLLAGPSKPTAAT